MHITRIAARNYRNLAEGELFPCQGVNVIYGGNAQGKTNLLESLWLFTGGHSFRGSKDSELPRLDQKTGKNTESAQLAMDFFSEGRNQQAQLHIQAGRRASVINGVKKKTGSALIGKVRAVIFSPEHLLLIKEGPARRRAFLDGALCQIRPGFAVLLNSYRRTLLQRNALLKDMFRAPELADTMEIWNQRLVKLGAQVMEERKKYTESIAQDIREIYGGIARGKEKIEVSYAPSVKGGETLRETEEIFLQELSRTAGADRRSGFTSIGPHRDDLYIAIDGTAAKAYGSQGQQRSAVLAMKLAEAQAQARFSGESPVVLLDDVMSELDGNRQDYLLNHLHGRQVFITCCSPETVNLMETGQRFRVEAGIIYPQELAANEKPALAPLAKENDVRAEKLK